MDMEDLLCPQISMDVDETPLELGVEVGKNDDTDLDTPEEMPSDIKIKILLETEEFDAAQVPEPLTEEEEALKKTVFNLGPAVQFLKLHCTSCNKHLGSAPINQFNRFIHPLLHVLLCKDCYDFYSSGDFEKDEDGSELYCRWCGQGGKVMCCSDCCFVFCQKCVRTNLGKKTLDSIKNSEEWKCFVCNPQQLINLKLICHSLYQYIVAQIKIAKETKNESTLTEDLSMCCKQTPKTAPNRPTKRKRTASTEDANYDPFVQDGLLKKTKQPKTTLPTPTVLPTNGRAVINPMSSNFIRFNNFVQTNNQARVPRPQFIPRFRMVGMQQRPNVSTSQNYISLPNPQPRLLHPPQRFKSVIGAVPSVIVPGMKHNWFDQAATLTTNISNQLLRKLNVFRIEQKNATSIEKLAGVHNQLQELLSNSVNQLIHIRKNLRTEFLSDLSKLKAGRPTPVVPPLTRLVPQVKSASPKPSTVAKDDDDDVILVSHDENDPLNLNETQAREEPVKADVDPNRPRPFLKLRPVSSLMASCSNIEVEKEAEIKTTDHIDLCDDDEDPGKIENPQNTVKADICGIDDEVECEIMSQKDDATRQQILRALLESRFEVAVVENSKIKIAPHANLTDREVKKMINARVIVDPKYIPKRKYRPVSPQEDVFLNEADKNKDIETIGISDSEDDENLNKEKETSNDHESTENTKEHEDNPQIGIESSEDVEMNENKDEENEANTSKLSNSDSEHLNKTIEEAEDSTTPNKNLRESVGDSITPEINNTKSKDDPISPKKNNTKSMEDSTTPDGNNTEIVEDSTTTDGNNTDNIEDSITPEINSTESVEDSPTPETNITETVDAIKTASNTEDLIGIDEEASDVDLNCKQPGDTEETMDVDDNKNSADEINKTSNEETSKSNDYDRRKAVSELEASADPITTTDSGIEVDAK